MRTRLFKAFLIIILIALLSNFIFQRLIVRDFDRYTDTVREDQIRWVLASVEGSYLGARWSIPALTDSLHWAMMLGIDARVVDVHGRDIMTSQETLRTLSTAMANHMAGLFHLEPREGLYKEYPLIVEREKVGTFFFRPFLKKEILERERIFKNKTEYFLYISLAIAGGGALLLALLLSLYLSKPLLRMKEAANRIAQGDLGARIRVTADRDARPRFGRVLWRGNEPDEIGSLAESFNVMAESLQREESLRKNLLSNIGHELRTPLTVMQTHLEALEDGILEDPGTTLKVVKAELERLVELIKGIEDLTLAEASFLKVSESSDINLKEFLEDVLSDLVPLKKEKDLTLKMARERDLVVATDVGKLEKIVRNLLSNAMKFTPQGEILVDYGQGDDTFFIEIQDTGVGIPEDQLPFIFNRFYRGDKSASPGLGLGLAIVKETVTALGGRIEVKSRVGEGTAFRLYLPLNPHHKSS